jgi:hypothetical protein
MDVDARIQLFDLKTKWQFQTTPGVDQYNVPLYDSYFEPGNQLIGMFPVYQGVTQPAFLNGIQIPLFTQKNSFFNIYPNIVQNLQVVGQGNGTQGPYSIQLPILSNTVPINPPVNCILRGHVDITGIIATGDNFDPPIESSFNSNIPVTSVNPAVWITSIDATGANVVVTDSGQFLEGNVNYGLLMMPGNAPFGNVGLPGGYSTTLNTINYLSGQLNVTFPVAIPNGVDINVQCFYFQTGLPRGVLFYNNVLTFRSPPDQSYLAEFDAYLTPAAFLNTGAAIPFGYMAEYIARGAARKILSDTGDWEQFKMYEPFFIEQENLVWKRSQRQWTATRTETVYSQGFSQGISGNNNYGGGTL